MQPSTIRTIRRTAREAVIFTLLGPVAAALLWIGQDIYSAPSPAPHSIAKMCSNYLASATPKPVDKPPPVSKPGWKTISIYSSSIYKRCHFSGYRACFNAGDYSGTDIIATLKQGDEVKLLSAKVRAADGSEIYKVGFGKWIGWVDSEDFELRPVPGTFIPVANNKAWAMQQASLPCLEPFSAFGGKADAFGTVTFDDEMFTGLGGLHTITQNRDLYVQTQDGTWLKFPNGVNIATDRLHRVIAHLPLTSYIDVGDLLIVSLLWGWPFGLGLWLVYRILRFAIKG